MENIENSAKDKVLNALKTDDNTEQAEAIISYMDSIANDLAQKFEEVKDSEDASVLASRGFRKLTTKEKVAFENIIEAMKGNNVKSALENTNTILPATIINQVFEDLESEYPLLAEIEFRNVTGLTEFLIRTGDKELAFWGDLCDEITKELSAGFDKASMGLYKLSAFLPVCKAMLDLGPTWLEAFVRAILVEALSAGLEQAIVTGTGNKMPIGMDRDLSNGTTSAGVTTYPQKAAVEFNDFKDILDQISVLTNDGKRKANGVIAVVNPVDYLTKVLPNIQYMNFNGTFVTSLRYPVKFIESTQANQGDMILGIGKRYFLGLGSTQKIEYSDHYKFLEDERVYLTKLYANGKPKDNTSFLRLDISGMTANNGIPVQPNTVTPEA